MRRCSNHYWFFIDRFSHKYFNAFEFVRPVWLHCILYQSFGRAVYSQIGGESFLFSRSRLHAVVSSRRRLPQIPEYVSDEKTEKSLSEWSIHRAVQDERCRTVDQRQQIQQISETRIDPEINVGWWDPTEHGENCLREFCDEKNAQNHSQHLRRPTSCCRTMSLLLIWFGQQGQGALPRWRPSKDFRRLTKQRWFPSQDWSGVWQSGVPRRDSRQTGDRSIFRGFLVRHD